ncbi:MAG: hypothetical protein DHS20C02_00460 [Micavibrio sp.]|nr:MAG: hypothetical protein DHS20C02_00460 [Micavibrio sp.]
MKTRKTRNKKTTQPAFEKAKRRPPGSGAAKSLQNGLTVVECSEEIKKGAQGAAMDRPEFSPEGRQELKAPQYNYKDSKPWLAG